MDGFSTAARQVHGEHFNYVMIGKQHRCNACKEAGCAGGRGKASAYKFPPWHPGVLRQLPRDLVEIFPAVILGRSAVDLALITRVEQALVSRMGVATLADHIRENHIKHFRKMEIR